jgi:hypothetical protein
VRWTTALVVLALAAAARAEPGRRAPDVDVLLPVEPREHRRLQWFDGQPHHLLPGTVTVDGPPYVCDLDDARFRSEDDFVAHLRGRHHVPAGRIRAQLVVRQGRVHFVGEPADR